MAERARVMAALAEQGWSVPDAQGNFVWLWLGERTAEFAAAADEAGVMVRPFTGEGVRVTIGEPAGNDVFLEVAARFAGAPVETPVEAPVEAPVGSPSDGPVDGPSGR